MKLNGGTTQWIMGIVLTVFWGFGAFYVKQTSADEARAQDKIIIDEMIKPLVAQAGSHELQIRLLEVKLENFETQIWESNMLIKAMARQRGIDVDKAIGPVVVYGTYLCKKEGTC